MNSLNLVFHKEIYRGKDDWEISPEFFKEIWIWSKKNLSSFRIYFDDGYILNDIGDILDEIASSTTLAVVTDKVNNEGYLSWKELVELNKRGFKISSHTVSHPSLGFLNSEDMSVINVDLGEYRNVPRGKQVLTVNEIKYQLIESRRILSDYGFKVNEIVFPYGLYTRQTISILDELAIYRYYATCDEKVYNGGKFVPRVLIRGTKSLDQNIKCLTRFIEKLK